MSLSGSELSEPGSDVLSLDDVLVGGPAVAVDASLVDPPALSVPLVPAAPGPQDVNHNPSATTGINLGMT